MFQRVHQRFGSIKTRRIGLASAPYRQAAHPASVGRRDPGGGIFDHKAVRGGYSQPLGARQKNVRRGLAMRHLFARNHRIEQWGNRQQPNNRLQIGGRGG